jgi:hypothetical protein
LTKYKALIWGQNIGLYIKPSRGNRTTCQAYVSIIAIADFYKTVIISPDLSPQAVQRYLLNYEPKVPAQKY